MALKVHVVKIFSGITRNATMFMERQDMQTSVEMEFVITRMMQLRFIALHNNVFSSIADGGKSFILMSVS